MLYPGPSTFSDHFTTDMVDVAPYEYLLLIVTPYGSKSSICVYSCFSSSENKILSCWIPHGYNHYCKSWSRCPWSWNLPSNRFYTFNYTPTEYYQHISAKMFYNTIYFTKINNYLLMYQLQPGLWYVDLAITSLSSLPCTISWNILPINKVTISVLTPKARLHPPLLIPN